MKTAIAVCQSNFFYIIKMSIFLLLSIFLKALSPQTEIDKIKLCLINKSVLKEVVSFSRPYVVSQEDLRLIMGEKEKEIVDILEEEQYGCYIESSKVFQKSIEDQLKERKKQSNRGYYTAIETEEGQFILILKVSEGQYAIMEADQDQVEDYAFLYEYLVPLVPQGIHPVALKKDKNLEGKSVQFGASIGFEIENLSQLILHRHKGMSLYEVYREKYSRSKDKKIPSILETKLSEKLNLSFDLYLGCGNTDTVEVRTEPIRKSFPFDEEGESLVNRTVRLCQGVIRYSEVISKKEVYEKISKGNNFYREKYFGEIVRKYERGMFLDEIAEKLKKEGQIDLRVGEQYKNEGYPPIENIKLVKYKEDTKQLGLQYTVGIQLESLTGTSLLTGHSHEMMLKIQCEAQKIVQNILGKYLVRFYQSRNKRLELRDIKKLEGYMVALLNHLYTIKVNKNLTKMNFNFYIKHNIYDMYELLDVEMQDFLKEDLEKEIWREKIYEEISLFLSISLDKESFFWKKESWKDSYLKEKMKSLRCFLEVFFLRKEEEKGVFLVSDQDEFKDIDDDPFKKKDRLLVEIRFPSYVSPEENDLELYMKFFMEKSGRISLYRTERQTEKSIVNDSQEDFSFLKKEREFHSIELGYSVYVVSEGQLKYLYPEKILKQICCLLKIYPKALIQYRKYIVTRYSEKYFIVIKYLNKEKEEIERVEENVNYILNKILKKEKVQRVLFSNSLLKIIFRKAVFPYVNHKMLLEKDIEDFMGKDSVLFEKGLKLSKGNFFKWELNENERGVLLKLKEGLYMQFISNFDFWEVYGFSFIKSYAGKFLIEGTTIREVCFRGRGKKVSIKAVVMERGSNCIKSFKNDKWEGSRYWYKGKYRIHYKIELPSQLLALEEFDKIVEVSYQERRKWARNEVQNVLFSIEKGYQLKLDEVVALEGILMCVTSGEGERIVLFTKKEIEEALSYRLKKQLKNYLKEIGVSGDERSQENSKLKDLFIRIEIIDKWQPRMQTEKESEEARIKIERKVKRMEEELGMLYPGIISGEFDKQVTRSRILQQMC